ncbi:MAG: hypothetical protein CBC42_03160 [Betaproteobacteria bacterium TMED82]|nr:MAG: hypothetical protein CBC42_03160 [Betaproteobacteria bacterium TMED82]|tara:strand:+ start:21756 stop:22115 length:360 start_codon:yes stop_codon:yes gene_type:complete
MPIYSYLCSACGAAKDVLQKLSDLPLVICPNCGRQTFSKQLTAAGFVLKGSGWYATDFKNQKKPEKKKSTVDDMHDQKNSEDKKVEKKSASNMKNEKNTENKQVKKTSSVNPTSKNGKK